MRIGHSGIPVGEAAPPRIVARVTYSLNPQQLYHKLAESQPLLGDKTHNHRRRLRFFSASSFTILL